MLFFFELFLFVLVMLTLALGEFVSRGLAMVLWLVATAFALVGYLLARLSLRPLVTGEVSLGPSSATGEAEAPPPGDEHETIGSEAPGPADPTPLDQRWARTLLYNWRRANVLLVIGAFAVAGWYWLAG